VQSRTEAAVKFLNETTPASVLPLAAAHQKPLQSAPSPLKRGWLSGNTMSA
jgi:hypothetical protein